MAERSRFISFEGGEAAGKTTQIERLAQRLGDLGHHVLITREPGGTQLGESLRYILKHAVEGRDMAPETELLLFLASRAELVRKVIVPALGNGSWVLSDRFLDSTTVYQGVGRKLPAEILARLNAFAVGPHLPGLTLVLDLDPAEGRRRRKEIHQEGVVDRMESEPAAFYDRVREGYLQLAKEHPGRIRVLSGDGSVDGVADRVWRAVSEAYGL